jgi:hypothetical protein
MIGGPTAADREVDLEEEQAELERKGIGDCWIAAVIRRCAAAERELATLKAEVKGLRVEVPGETTLPWFVWNALKRVFSAAGIAPTKEPALPPSS